MSWKMRSRQPRHIRKGLRLLTFSSIRATARQRCNGSPRGWRRISVEILAARALKAVIIIFLKRFHRLHFYSSNSVYKYAISKQPNTIFCGGQRLELDRPMSQKKPTRINAVSYTHLRAHETD